jgi:hypothetical protein
MGIITSRDRSDEKNQALAKKYFGKSCDLGYQKGCDRYARLNSSLKAN